MNIHYIVENALITICIVGLTLHIIKTLKIVLQVIHDTFKVKKEECHSLYLLIEIFNKIKY